MQKDVLLALIHEVAEKSAQPSATVRVKTTFPSANKITKEALEKADDEELLRLTGGLFEEWCRGEDDDLILVSELGPVSYAVSNGGGLLRATTASGTLIVAVGGYPRTVHQHLVALYGIKEGQVIPL